MCHIFIILSWRSLLVFNRNKDLSHLWIASIYDSFLLWQRFFPIMNSKCLFRLWIASICGLECQWLWTYKKSDIVGSHSKLIFHSWEITKLIFIVAAPPWSPTTSKWRYPFHSPSPVLIVDHFVALCFSDWEIMKSLDCFGFHFPSFWRQWTFFFEIFLCCSFFFFIRYQAHYFNGSFVHLFFQMFKYSLY